MYIVEIASECAPAAKAGGLGDVVNGLSRELQTRTQWVEIILPLYDCMRYDRMGPLEKVYHDLWVPWYGGSIPCSVFLGPVDVLRCDFLQPPPRGTFFPPGPSY